MQSPQSASMLGILNMLEIVNEKNHSRRCSPRHDGLPDHIGYYVPL